MRVLLRSRLDAGSSYGDDGIALALALRQAGCQVLLDPVCVRAPLPLEVAELLTQRVQAPFDLYLHHGDPGQLGMEEMTRQSAGFTIAHTMWQASTLDNLCGRSKLKKNLRDYDLVVGYDGVSTQALGPYVTTSSATVQGGYWPRFWSQQYRDWNCSTLNLCVVSDGRAGEDVFMVLDAFRELREEHPTVGLRLNVTTTDPAFTAKAGPRIDGLTVFNDVWSEHTQREFYANNHVLIAAGRGGGRNIAALEMLSTGGTVIATNWGGHTQWLSSQISYPLRHVLEPLSAASPECQWAKADKAHLKELILHAYHHREELAHKGDLAAQLIPSMCSWPKVVDRLMERMGEVDQRGERMLHKYRVAKARAQEMQQAMLL